MGLFSIVRSIFGSRKSAEQLIATIPAADDDAFARVRDASRERIAKFTKDRETWAAQVPIRTLELEAAEAALAEVEAPLLAAQASAAALRARLAELEAMESPTQDSMLEEATTKRRLARLDAEIAERSASVDAARSARDSAEASLDNAKERLTAAELREEAFAILGDVDLFRAMVVAQVEDHFSRASAAGERSLLEMFNPKSHTMIGEMASYVRNYDSSSAMNAALRAIEERRDANGGSLAAMPAVKKPAPRSLGDES